MDRNTIATVISDVDSLWIEVRKEFFLILDWVVENDDHAHRRVLIRTMASNIEAFVNMSAHMLVSVPERVKDSEQTLLNEVRYELSCNGVVKEKEKHTNTLARWRLIVRIIEREISASHYKVNFNDHRFDLCKKLFKVRNRITHPKVYSNYNIDADEMKDCLDGFKWFLECYQGIHKLGNA